MTDRTYVNGVSLTDAADFQDFNDTCYDALAIVAGAAASVTKVQFPATAVPSADANALDDYQESSTTFTLTGCTTSPTYVGKWTKIGNVVTLSFPGTSYLSGTSNATSKTLTGMPAEIRPSGTIYGSINYASDNAAGTTGYISITAAGVIVLDKAQPTGVWTNSGAWDFYIPMMSWTVA